MISFLLAHLEKGGRVGQQERAWQATVERWMSTMLGNLRQTNPIHMCRQKINKTTPDTRQAVIRQHSGKTASRRIMVWLLMMTIILATMQKIILITTMITTLIILTILALHLMKTETTHLTMPTQLILSPCLIMLTVTGRMRKAKRSRKRREESSKINSTFTRTVRLRSSSESEEEKIKEVREAKVTREFPKEGRKLDSPINNTQCQGKDWPMPTSRSRRSSTSSGSSITSSNSSTVEVTPPSYQELAQHCLLRHIHDLQQCLLLGDSSATTSTKLATANLALQQVDCQGAYLSTGCLMLKGEGAHPYPVQIPMWRSPSGQAAQSTGQELGKRLPKLLKTSKQQARK